MSTATILEFPAKSPNTGRAEARLAQRLARVAPDLGEFCRCFIGEAWQPSALVPELAPSSMPGSVADLAAQIRPGFSTWLPSSAAFDLMVWCRDRGIPITVQRPRSFEALMPDEAVGPILDFVGLGPETTDNPRFLGTIKANHRRQLFACQVGIHGSCGVLKLSSNPECGDEIGAGDAGLWLSNASKFDVEIVIVASPLDALAFETETGPSRGRRHIAVALPLTAQLETVLFEKIAELAEERGHLPQITVAVGTLCFAHALASRIAKHFQVSLPRWEPPPEGHGWFEWLRRRARTFRSRALPAEGR